tara:strand:- start:71 stop:448 length:378 start_codon:yes stop_codon:yes gene_type:complete
LSQDGFFGAFDKQKLSAQSLESGAVRASSSPFLCARLDLGPTTLFAGHAAKVALNGLEIDIDGALEAIGARLEGWQDHTAATAASNLKPQPFAYQVTQCLDSVKGHRPLLNVPHSFRNGSLLLFP